MVVTCKCLTGGNWVGNNNKAHFGISFLCLYQLLVLPFLISSFGRKETDAFLETSTFSLCNSGSYVFHFENCTFDSSFSCGCSFSGFFWFLKKLSWKRNFLLESAFGPIIELSASTFAMIVHVILQEKRGNKCHNWSHRWLLQYAIAKVRGALLRCHFVGLF